MILHSRTKLPRKYLEILSNVISHKVDDIEVRIIEDSSLVIDEITNVNDLPQLLISSEKLSFDLEGICVSKVYFISDKSCQPKYFFFEGKLGLVLIFLKRFRRIRRLAFFLFQLASSKVWDSLISNGEVYVYHKKSLGLDSIGLGMAIEIGYNGYYSTPTSVELSRNKRDVLFSKYSISEYGKKAIELEFQNLRNIQGLRSKFIELPIVKELVKGKRLVTATDVDLALGSQNLSFDSIKWNFVKDLFLRSNRRCALNELKLWDRINVDIDYIASQNSETLTDYNLNSLLLLKNSIHDLIEVNCYQGHMDFTPWNCKSYKGRLIVYDWELSGSLVPEHYDVFHYLFSRSIFLENGDYFVSYKKFNEELTKNISSEYVQKNGGLIELTVAFYLLFNCIERLKSVDRQGFISLKEKMLLKHLFAGVDEISKVVRVTHRVRFLNYLKSLLQKFNYVLLRHGNNDIIDLNEFSDLDILIDSVQAQEFLDFVKKYYLVSDLNLTKRSHMWIIKVYFFDSTFLYLDLIFKLTRKGLLFLDEKLLLENHVTNDFGLRTSKYYLDFEYNFLFSYLNGSETPRKYNQMYYDFIGFSGASLTGYLNKKYGIGISSVLELNTYDLVLKKKVNSVISSSMGLGYRFLNGLKYVWDVFLQITKPEGFEFVFYGVDGSGKSTAIKKLKGDIEKVTRKRVQVRRHRPNFLPLLSSIKYGSVKKANAMDDSENPRQGSSSFVSGLIRFIYYFLDYLVGQVFIYVKHLCKGEVVVYDRYYLDFVVDQKRSNIRIGKRIPLLFYRLVRKPRLNILFICDPKVIYNRKKETDIETITRLNKDYSELFEAFRNRSKYRDSYHIIDNTDLNKTRTEIINILKKNKL